MSGERNEKSVLISLDSLTAATPNQTGQGDRDETSGLIDIGALESAGLVAGDETPSAGAGFTAASAIQVAAPRSANLAVVLIAVVAALGLVAGGVFLGMEYMGEQPADPALANQPSSAPAGSVASAATSAPESGVASVPASGVASTPASGLASAPGSGVASAGAAALASAAASTPTSVAKAPVKRPRVRRPRKTPSSKTPTSKAPVVKAPTSKAVAAVKPPVKPESTDEVDDMLNPKGKTGTPGLEAVDPLLPAKLSRRQIIAVVRKNAAAVRQCNTLEPKTGGRVDVSMLIKRNGSVESAKVVSAQKGTPMGNCVERKVKVFRFEAFSGPPMRLKMPFSL
jgi:hypothetical protein